MENESATFNQVEKKLQVAGSRVRIVCTVDIMFD